MSLSKIVIIVVVSGIVLFILFLVYTLSPTIRNVTSHKTIRTFTNHPLKLKREAGIYYCPRGEYRFLEYVLFEQNSTSNELKYNLSVGTEITIRKFKTYKSNSGSGSTHLYALCEWTDLNGQKIEFEYYWGDTDPSFYSKESAVLPLAFWQDSTDVMIHFEAD